MASRDLPNVYVTLNDMSALIEGSESLSVGVTLRADRGPVGEALRVTDSDDFLTRFTFTGKPGAKQDSTFFDVIELLKASNNVYVSRAANNPLYGGLVVKREKEIARFGGVAEYNQKRLIVDGLVADKFPNGSYIRIAGDNGKSFRYVVSKAEETGDKTSVLLTEKVSQKLIDALEAAKAVKGNQVKNGALVGDVTRLEALGLDDIEEIRNAIIDDYAAYEEEVEKLNEVKVNTAAEYQEALDALKEAVAGGDEDEIAAAQAIVDGTIIAIMQKSVEEAYAKVEENAEKAYKLGCKAVTLPIYICTVPKQITSYFYKDEDLKDVKDIVRTAHDVADEEKGYNGAFELGGNWEEKFFVGDRLKLTFAKDTKVKLADEKEYFYTVVQVVYDPEIAGTMLYVKEAIEGVFPRYEAPEDGSEGVHAGVYFSVAAIANPETFQVMFEEDDLFLITGKDQGAYNAQIGIAIESGVETELNEPAGAFKLYVHNDKTGVDLEEFLVALNPSAKATNGVNIEIEGIIEDEATGSKYIQVIKNAAIDFSEENITPPSTPGRATNTFVELGGGYDGDELTVADDINALEVFADKNVSVSLLINGGVENILYQLAMLSICESRKDCFAILRTFRSHEKIALVSQRVKSMIDYKKETLGSTEYLAAMYGPHVTTYDTFNSRNVTIGADSVACRRWIEVIRDYGYPRAAAGVEDGFIGNVTLDWKIGDESGEAKEFNDASMNMIVWDAKRKFYYFQTQNTLQLANSAFRNMGAVLNVLDIKEWMNFNLKYYIQKPIDGEGQLQEAILRTIEGYMDGCKSGGRVTDYFIQDVTTKTNISNNELHFVLTLCPAYYAQKIYLAINVVNATFDFQILQSM